MLRSGIQQHCLVLICFFKSHPRPVGLPEWWDSGTTSDLEASESQGGCWPVQWVLLACYKYQMCLTPTVFTISVGVYRGLFSVVTCACSCREAESEARPCCGKWMSPGRLPPTPPTKGQLCLSGEGRKMTFGH